MKLLLTIQATGFRVSKYQPLHGPGNAHIGQAALFLHAPGLLQRHTVREQTLLNTCQEHHRKLQPLGRMQRHQLHTVLMGIGL